MKDVAQAVAVAVVVRVAVVERVTVVSVEIVRVAVVVLEVG